MNEKILCMNKIIDKQLEEISKCKEKISQLSENRKIDQEELVINYFIHSLLNRS